MNTSTPYALHDHHDGHRFSRRRLLQASAVVAAASLLPRGMVRAAPAAAPRKAPGEKLNIALIGTAGRASNTIRDFCKLDENIVALCDVDPARLQSGVKLSAERFPEARTYQDYRKMLDAEKGLDAVVVTTPDHMHAPVSLLAMSRGLHVFCEKPLTRTVWESRRVRDAARASGVVTQMGTQGSASESVRRAVELLHAGILGPVSEVHVWTDRVSRVPEPAADDAMPKGFDWDLWLGVASQRPFKPKIYHPSRWRWWTDFGGGALGDMGCHLTNAAFRGLDLSDPDEVDVEVGAPQLAGMFPSRTKVIYHFPERNGRAALTMTWYDSGLVPDQALFESSGILEQFKKINPSDQLIIGEKGMMFGDAFVKLNGEKAFLPFAAHEACLAVPQTAPRNKEQGTVGHYREWVSACKGEGTAFASFDIGAAQTEMVLIGCIAAQIGHKIRWDAANMTVPGEPSAAAMIRPAYRPGFTVDS